MIGTQGTFSKRESANRTSTHVLLAFLIVALVVGFAIENGQRVTVDYLYASRDSRLAYVIFGSAILGALAARLLVRRGR